MNTMKIDVIWGQCYRYVTELTELLEFPSLYLECKGFLQKSEGEYWLVFIPPLTCLLPSNFPLSFLLSSTPLVHHQHFPHITSARVERLLVNQAKVFFLLVVFFFSLTPFFRSLLLTGSVCVSNASCWFFFLWLKYSNPTASPCACF